MRIMLVIVLVTFLPLLSFAQSNGSGDTSGDIEQILSAEGQQSATEDEAPEKPQAPVETVDPKELSDLGRLAPFSDVAVIQKRFLPKTSRLEFNPNVGAILNDVFYQSTSLSARLAYYFSEQYAVEISALGYSTGERKAVKDLEKGAVSTQGFITPYSYYGLDFKWIPIYGKMGFMNDSVVPFDMYFTAGGGITNTNQKTSPSTVHAGIGQIFASNKWLAFRWDMSFFWYSSKYTLNSGKTGTDTFMNMHLTLGASFFFPEAKYR